MHLEKVQTALLKFIVIIILRQLLEQIYWLNATASRQCLHPWRLQLPSRPSGATHEDEVTGFEPHSFDNLRSI